MSGTYLDSVLGENERVLLITHQHWFILVRNILLEVVLILIIIGVSVLSSTLLIGPLAYLGLLLVIIPLVGLIHDFLVWHNNQYIVTNRRVIQTVGIINKNTTESSLEKVNDVKMAQNFLGRLFNYGTVEILTASELGINTFYYIGSPVRFKTVMLNAKEGLSDGDDHPIAKKKSHEEDISSLIEELDTLRKKGILTEQEFQQKKADLLSRL